MIALIAVLRIAANISSAIASNEFWMISKVTGSLIGCMTVPRLCLLDMDVAVGVHRRAGAGMNDNCRRRILDHRGTGKAHAWLEFLSIVNVGLMNPLYCIVDKPAA